MKNDMNNLIFQIFALRGQAQKKLKKCRFLAFVAAVLLSFNFNMAVFAIEYDENFEILPQIQLTDDKAGNDEPINIIDNSDTINETDFMANYANESLNFIYDPQPATKEDILSAIDEYNARFMETLETQGFDAALNVAKPRWQYEVDAFLIPEGYYCLMISDDVSGAVYYTFFEEITMVPLSIQTIDNYTNLLAAVNAAPKTAPDNETPYIIEITGNIDLGGSITVPAGANIAIQSDSENQWILTRASSSSNRHFKINGILTLENIILDGGDKGGGVVVQSGGTFYMNNGTIIQNCRATGTSGNGAGGGIEVLNNGKAEVNGGIIRNNIVTGTNGGGGVYVAGANAAFTIIGGEITGNRSLPSNGPGGGIGGSTNATITIKDSIISDNHAEQMTGGGVNAGIGVTLNIENSIISNNTTSSVGGGIYLNYNTKIYMDNTTVSYNKASNSGGGIGCIVSSSTTVASIDINESTIFGNEASGNGGGIYINLQAAATGSINKCEIYNNTAYNGGGIYGYTGSIIDINDSKINNNTATSNNGGGVYSSTMLNINTGSIISGNKAAINGGGIYGASTSTINVSGSTIENNTASSGDGGGIYTADKTYSKVSVNNDSVFTGNKASAAYIPPENASTAYNGIESSSVSISFADYGIEDHPLNNYDINYISADKYFIVTYDANGGTGSVKNQPIKNKSNALLNNGDKFQNTPFVLAGWTKSPDGKTEYALGGTITNVTSDIMLYAVWMMQSEIPSINEIKEGNREVSGTGVPDAEILVVFPNGETETAIVDENGDWTVTVPEGTELHDGDTVTASQIEKDKSFSLDAETIVMPADIDKVQSETPSINEIKEGDREVSGTGVPGAEILIVFPDGETETAIVDDYGDWTVNIPDGTELHTGDTITASQTEKDKTLSTDVETIVVSAEIDEEQSEAPSINEIKEGDREVSGTGVPGAEILIVFPNGETETAIVDDYGDWTVNIPDGTELHTGDTITASQTEKDKILSLDVETIVKSAKIDEEQSEAPIINEIKEGDREVSGKGVPGAEILIVFPNGETETVIVDDYGDWIVNVPNGTELHTGDIVTAGQIENGKILSLDAEAIVIPVDISRMQSETPSINEIKEGDRVVSGKGVPGAEILIIFPNGETETAIVDDYGDWFINVPYGTALYAGDIVKANQTENGKISSNDISTTVSRKNNVGTTDVPDEDVNDEYTIYPENNVTVNQAEDLNEPIPNINTTTILEYTDNEIIDNNFAVLPEISENSNDLNFLLEYPPGYQIIQLDDNNIELNNADETLVGLWANEENGWTYYANPNEPQLEPSDDGSFEVIDQDSIPIGVWNKNEDDEWIYEESPKVNIFNWVALCALIGLLAGIYFFIIRRRNISRGEFVRMVVKAVNLNTDIENIEPYKDVPRDSIYYHDVMNAKAANILSGFLAAEFKPNNAITREEMSSILVGTIRYSNAPIKIENLNLKDIFKDYKSINNMYLTDIQLVVQLKIMNGNNDKFNPKGLSIFKKAANTIENMLKVISNYLPSGSINEP